MSTTFGVLKSGVSLLDIQDKEHLEDYCIEVAFTYGIGKGKISVSWKNEVAKLLSPNTQVYALDNGNQGIHTIKDLLDLELLN